MSKRVMVVACAYLTAVVSVVATSGTAVAGTQPRPIGRWVGSGTLMPAQGPRPAASVRPSKVAPRFAGAPTFPAQTPNGISPGEPSVAVKATAAAGFILQTVNGGWTVYGRGTGSTTSGVLRSTQRFSDFFGEGDCDDPVPVYWAWDDRWAFVCRDTAGVKLRLAISANNDPTQGWWWYGFPAPNGLVLDAPSITVTSDKIVLVSALFNASNVDQNKSVFYAINKSAALAQQTPYNCSIQSTTGHLYRAAVRYTNDSPDARAVSTSTSFPVPIIVIANVSGAPPSAASSQCPQLVEVAQRGGAGPHTLRDAAIPGGGLHFGTQNDNRVYNAVEERDTADNHDIIEFSNMENVGNQLGVAATRLDFTASSLPPPIPNVVHTYYFWEGNTGVDYTMGAVALDAAGNVFATYSRSSANTSPEAMEGEFTASGAWVFDIVIYGQVNDNCGPGPNCRERWGDYLGATQNGADPSEIFVSSLYQASATNPAEIGWGTVIAAARANAVE
jgi:hypothetical protein